YSSSLHLHRRRLCPRLRPRRPLRPHLRHRLRLCQCAPCAHMVFTELFEFFVAFFELCRRVLRFIRPCARSSGVTSSLRTAPPRRHRRRPLLPLRLLQQLRAASASSSSPFFCACDRRGGLLCWSLQLGYLDIGTKGYHPHELLAGFLSSRSIRTTPTL